MWAQGADIAIGLTPLEDNIPIGQMAMKGLIKWHQIANASNRMQLNTRGQKKTHIAHFEPKGHPHGNQNNEIKGFDKEGGLFTTLPPSIERRKSRLP